MDWKLEHCAIPGCVRVFTKHASDSRGTFVKLFQHSVFADEPLLSLDVREVFYTVSKRGVLRGMHFQRPPHDHVKAVTCMAGSVIDVVVDLRLGSPAYGKHATFELSADTPSVVMIPAGLAHGFFATSAEALVAYAVSTEHAPSHDAGIRWDSAGIDWPTQQPNVSERDAALPPLDEFSSPFSFVGDERK